MALANNRRIFDMAAHTWREDVEELQMQCAPMGTSLATFLEQRRLQWVAPGLSVSSVPLTLSALDATTGRVSARYDQVAPTATPLSGSGYYGQSCPREIPDTPLTEWTAGVEALLADCAHWQAQTEEVLHDPA